MSDIEPTPLPANEGDGDPRPEDYHDVVIGPDPTPPRERPTVTGEGEDGE